MTVPAPTCPACGSPYISAGERGVSVGRAIGGGLLLGGVGLLAGAVGRKDVVLGCMTCGHRWEPSLSAPAAPQPVRVSTKASLIALAVFMAFIAVLCAGAVLLTR